MAIPPIDAWSVFIDLGCVSVLILIGFAIRTASVWVQRLFLPTSVIAGCGGLACGPNGLDILPFSSLLPQYPSVLITLVFAALPFTSRSVSRETGSRRAVELGSYSAAIVLLQWGLGVLFGPDCAGLRLAGFAARLRNHTCQRVCGRARHRRGAGYGL